MKRTIIFTLSFICLQQTFAQSSNYWPTTGAVGIGTGGAPTVGKLQIENPTDNVIHFITTVNGNGRVSIGSDASANTYIHSHNNVDLSLGVGANHFTIKYGGNIGIGTSTPAQKLEVNGIGAFTGSLPNGNTAVGTLIGSGRVITLNGTSAMDMSVEAKNITFSTGNFYAEKMRIDLNGNVGIGTTNPLSPLQVGTVAGVQTAAGQAEFTGNLYFDGTNWRYTTSNYGGIANIDPTSGNLGFYTASSGSANAIASSLSAKMLILNNGNIGIGTSIPSEKLSVNGNIKTQKLIVTQTGWSDYVFNDDYKLRSLQQLESYIKENKHLPEVPSAKEVEEKGISVGDNQALLLKKIEELTLYIIEMEKEIRELKKDTKQ